MPREQLGINITSGNRYEVLIKTPDAEIIYRDTFVYLTTATRTPVPLGSG